MHVMFDSPPQSRTFGNGNKIQEQTGGLFFEGLSIPMMFKAQLGEDQPPYELHKPYVVSRDHFSVGEYGRLQFNARTPFVPVQQADLKSVTGKGQ